MRLVQDFDALPQCLLQPFMLSLVSRGFRHAFLGGHLVLVDSTDDTIDLHRFSVFSTLAEASYSVYACFSDYLDVLWHQLGSRGAPGRRRAR